MSEEKEYHFLNWRSISGKKEVRFLSAYFPKGSNEGVLLSDKIPDMKIPVTQEEVIELWANPLFKKILSYIKDLK